MSVQPVYSPVVVCDWELFLGVQVQVNLVLPNATRLMLAAEHPQLNPENLVFSNRDSDHHLHVLS